MQTILAAITERQRWREQYAAAKLWTLFQQPAHRHPGKASTQVFPAIGNPLRRWIRTSPGVAGRPVAGGPRSPEPPTQVESLYGGVMSKFRLAVCTGFAASALLLIPAGSASAHVHGITPLRCTDAPVNSGGAAGANVAFVEADPEAGLTGVIPITMGGNVVLNEEGFDAAVCDD